MTIRASQYCGGREARIFSHDVGPKFLLPKLLLLQQMVLTGLGISLLQPITVRDERKEGRLIHILPELSSEELLFSLVYPPSKQLPKRTQAVIDSLLKEELFTKVK